MEHVSSHDEPGRTTPLGALGRTVADVGDRLLTTRSLAGARRRVLDAPTRAARPVPRAVWALAAAVACAAAVLLWGLGRAGKPPFGQAPRVALSFAVGPAGTPGAVGDWVAADERAPLDVRFSEGSLVALTPGARLRVLETNDNGAGLLLERGTLEARIAHASGDTSWVVRAGPFAVHVTGTRFALAWDATGEHLDLTMREGSVVVTGPLLPPGRSVVAGEHLSVSVREGKILLGTASVDDPTGRPGDTSASAPPASPTPGNAEPPSATPGASAPRPDGSGTPRDDSAWQTLAARGKYRDAMDAAERAGFESEVARASSSELSSLADAARFGGRPARARDALIALRKRFGARGKSAFLLGKIAADQLGSPGDAATWFETYLAEEPGGALAEQALGRLVDLKRARDPSGARRLAERYLARYPNGGYAPLARSVVGSP